MRFDRFTSPQSLDVLRDDSPEAERLRRRALACAGAAVFFGGFLVALGFASLALALLAAMLFAAATVVVVLAVRRARPRVSFSRPRLVVPIDRQRVLESGGRTAEAVSRRLTDARRAAGRLMHASQRRLAARRPAPAAPSPPDRHREAMRLNALGTKLRRSGNGRWAAEQHRAALTIFEELDDRRSTALTLNNLALAVAHDGDLDSAIADLERAADILRGLDDTEHEARVIANLGFTYRRRGYDETATNLLQQALDKLSPASPDYRRVEQELRRAS